MLRKPCLSLFSLHTTLFQCTVRVCHILSKREPLQFCGSGSVTPTMFYVQGDCENKTHVTTSNMGTHFLCEDCKLKKNLVHPVTVKIFFFFKIGLGSDGQRLALICYPWLHFTILGKKIISLVETGESQKSHGESSKALLSCKPEGFIFSILSYPPKSIGYYFRAISTTSR